MDAIFGFDSNNLLLSFNRESHIKYLCALLKGLPKEYSFYSHDMVTAVYFLICSLDMLNSFDKSPFTRKQIIEWVYAHQLPPSSKYCGFMGGNLLPVTEYNAVCHLANTYCGLALLILCGDDLSRVDKRLGSSLKDYQNPDTGCFQALPIPWGPGEEDIRAVYCACCIAALLNDWSGVNKDKLIEHLKKCQNYTGGCGWIEDCEPHSGLTYCVVSSLGLMERMDVLENKKAIIEYAINRYDGGWNGRPAKVDDACYSYWNGSTLECLGISLEEMIGSKYTEEFLYSCQRDKGGFGKYVFSEYPDALHTFYSLATLSFFSYFYR